MDFLAHCHTGKAVENVLACKMLMNSPGQRLSHRSYASEKPIVPLY